MSKFGKIDAQTKRERASIVEKEPGWRFFDDWLDPFESLCGPILCRQRHNDDDAQLEFGFRAERKQCSVNGHVSGGWIQAFADIVMSNVASAYLERSKPLDVEQGTRTLVTVSTNVNFCGAAKIGQWICAPNVCVYRATRSLLFVRGDCVDESGALIASFHSIMKIVRIVKSKL
jgi:acyl-coenzyme A thioesterase PaaI-like protein